MFPAENIVETLRIQVNQAIAAKPSGFFYAGARRLLANDSAAAADLFRKSLATRQCTSSEYQLAAAELKTLDNPPPPKNP